MKKEKNVSVMAYRTFKLGEYADIRLGDGIPQAVRTIAEASGESPQTMLRLLLDDFLKTVRSKAEKCKNTQNPCI